MIDALKHELAQTIRNYNSKGWSPATSTNYSFRDSQDSEVIFVSKSGVDKSLFTSEDFMEINKEGQPINFSILLKPSAETGIHCAIYKLFPETTVVLHSHSIYPVLWSKENTEMRFEGYEIQKGFEGIKTHEGQVTVLIVENSQDMEDFKTWLTTNKAKIKTHCFMIKGHGTYAWGRNLFEAKRHLETLDYLCELEWKKRKV